jgi:hypothetical protein
MKSFRSYVAAGLGFATLVTIIFLATGWGSAVAAQITSVLVTNDVSHPVPVHEQGIANVNVVGSSLAASGNRLIQVASHLSDPSSTVATAWVNTSDCRRIVGYVTSGAIPIGFTMALQTTPDPSLHNGDALATYQGFPTSGYQKGYDKEFTVNDAGSGTDPQPDGQPVVAPYSRALIEDIGNAPIQDVSAWLYCVR